LIGSGHPLGATGIAQTIEITEQLQSCANKRQIENAEIGLVHNMSAAATSSTVLILER
jgi:acetyl-CoA C-acetyltransferase